MLTTPMDVITTREATTIQPPPAADTTTVMGPAATSTQVVPGDATTIEPAGSEGTTVTTTTTAMTTATTREPGYCFFDEQPFSCRIPYCSTLAFYEGGSIRSEH